MSETNWIEMLTVLAGAEYALCGVEHVLAVKLGNRDKVQQSLKRLIEDLAVREPLQWLSLRVEDAVDQFGADVLDEVEAKKVKRALGPAWPTVLFGTHREQIEVVEQLLQDGYSGNLRSLQELSGMLVQ